MVHAPEESGELPNCFVENWKKLVGLKTKLVLQSINRLELKSHPDEKRSLHIRERNRALWQHLEVELCNGWNKIHDQMEVHQVAAV